MNRILEVCCGSYYDCIQAFKGNADRVELSTALHMGGLTPSISSLVLTKKNTTLKVICMARPRGAGFCYEKEYYESMLMDIKTMLEYGADGIAFGCLEDNGNINKAKTKEVVDMIKSYGKEAVFHRAFDCVSNPVEAIETLISLGVDRVLTSGLAAKAPDGIELLKKLQKDYGNSIQILAGSGINADNAPKIMDYTGITQIHSSCKTWLKDKTTTKNHVSYAYTDDNYAYDVVDSELTRKLSEIVHNKFGR